MSGKLTPIAASLASGEPAKSDKPGEYVARLLKASPPLDDEIRRLVSIHGWEAVAKASKRLAKPNQRREMQRQDWKILGPILKEEAARILRGEKPRTNSALAALALPHVSKTDPVSGTRRLLLRLASDWRLDVHAHCTIQIAKMTYPWPVLVDVCSKPQPTKMATEDAFNELKALEDVLAELRKAGQPVGENATATELEASANKIRQEAAARILLGNWPIGETK